MKSRAVGRFWRLYDGPRGRTERRLYSEKIKGEGDFPVSWLHRGGRALHSAGQTPLNRRRVTAAETKKVAEALKKDIDPLKVLGILRRDISTLFLQPTRAQESAYMFSPREVILFVDCSTRKS